VAVNAVPMSAVLVARVLVSVLLRPAKSNSRGEATLIADSTSLIARPASPLAPIVSHSPTKSATAASGFRRMFMLICSLVSAYGEICGVA
jgi:hypothetical protein